MDGGLIEVTIGKVFLRKALDVYAANFIELGLGCNVVEAGMQFCFDRQAEYKYINFVWEGAVVPRINVQVNNCGTTGTNLVRGYRHNMTSTGLTNFSNCTTETGAKNYIDPYNTASFSYKSSYSDGAWWRTGWTSRLDAPGVQIASADMWNASLVYFIESGVTKDQPSIADLQAKYGIQITGNFTDVGWSPIGPPSTNPDPSPGGGGGTTGPYCRDGSSPNSETGLCADGSTPSNDRPGDTETNCWVLDIPCNFRKLFIPTQNWGDQYGALNVSSKAPFGLVEWVPKLNCAGSTPGVPWQGCGAPIDGNRHEVVDLVGAPGDLFGSLKFRVPNPALTFNIPVPGSGLNNYYFEFDLKETPYMDLWHRHMRIWLFWGFVAMFVLGAVNRFIT
jgi:hypothetical protein